MCTCSFQHVQAGEVQQECGLPPNDLTWHCLPFSCLLLQAGAVQQEYGLPITPEEFVTSTLKFGLTEVRCAAAAAVVL